MADVMSRLSSVQSDAEDLSPESRVGRFAITRRLGAGAKGNAAFKMARPDEDRELVSQIEGGRKTHVAP